MTLLLLRLQLLLRQLGWGNLCAVLLLLLGAGAWTWWLPHLRQQNSALQAEVGKLDASLRAPAALLAAPAEPPSSAKNITRFYENLGQQEYVEQQVKTLFALAKKAGLTLQQGEYKASFERQGKFYKYQIVLPVKGQYGVIRQFAESVLVAIPFAALDELNFKRDHISNRVLEAKLRFTLYLSDEAITSEQAS